MIEFVLILVIFFLNNPSLISDPTQQ